MELLREYSFLVWIVFGAVAGLIARLIVPGRDPGGCLITIGLGIAGAVVAGFLGRMLNIYRPEEQGAGFLAAIVGAVIILFIYRLATRRR